MGLHRGRCQAAKAAGWTDEAVVDIVGGTGRTSNEVREVVLAAWDGRVDVLFVAVDIRLWGTFASDTRTIEIADEAPGQNEDLLNLAAIHTVLNRGTVYAVPPAEMPDPTEVAAVPRY